MFPYAVAVALIAALSIVSGAASGDKLTLGLGAIGLLLAMATWRATSISAFLRLFIVIFAVEFVITGAAYLLGQNGWWPASLAAIKIPSELPLTVGLFGLLVYAISFIPVIRTITGLADPYFDASNAKTAQIPLLGQVHERTLAWALVIALVVINQLQVGINVRLSFFNRDMFNALQNKEAATFWTLLYTVFFFWAMVSVASNLIEYFFENVLKIRWREYLVERYGSKWLNEGAHYRMGFGTGADNPDQRIAEDVRSYINNSYAFSISLLSTISNLVSFSIILWAIPVQFPIPGTDIIIPGLPFWIALIYSLIGTWITHLIGKPLIKLDFKQEKYEADFRYSLARLREYGEQIALLKGEGAERQHIGKRFSAIVGNYYALVRQNLKLNTFVASYFQASAIVPFVIMAPSYFAGKLTLGQLTQTAGAFGRVETSMQWFIARYQSIAAYKAVVDRLTTFQDAIRGAENLQGKSAITLPSQPGEDITIPSLSLAIPSGETIVRIKDLTLRSGETTLVTGPSGSGKSTLFRAISGIWPFGQGAINVPEGRSVMLLPQRPYLPMGTLREAVQYPGLSGDHDDATMNAALLAARLPKLVNRLDEEAMWAQVLSLGEQQRLAVARALITKPDWLFLDEATAALDEQTEAAIYAILAKELPATTVVSIGHRSTLIDMHKRRIDLKIGDEGVFNTVDLSAPKAVAKKAGVAAKPVARETTAVKDQTHVKDKVPVKDKAPVKRRTKSKFVFR
jgi:vitamin B12/bleomycin/antimicrobial peptide transport system ATP-binding/permease protein